MNVVRRSSALFFILLLVLPPAPEAVAGFAANISYSIGEEYNDNIFFNNAKKVTASGATECPRCNVTDFITHLVPRFTILYAPPSEVTPVFTATLSPEGQIFAHQSELNNFGDNLSFNAGYTYNYSRRLIFHLAETLSRRGITRTMSLGALGPPTQLPSTPTQFPATGAIVPLSLAQGAGGLVTSGRTFANHATIDGAYLYSPNFTISGAAGTGYAKTDRRSEFSHSAGFRGVYNWRQTHNLHAGYTINIINSDNTSSGGGGGGTGNRVIHNIDIGDDYFSALKLQLDPTLTLSGSTGIAINTSGTGPRVVNNLSLTLVKLWQTAVFNLAVRRGLTSSFGISGLSQTTSFSGGFGIRLTERLTGNWGFDYSMFETDRVDFDVFTAAAGVQYWITPWISSSFWYNRRWRDAGSGANNNAALVSAGRIAGNSVLLAFSFYFDVWPNVGLSRASTQSLLYGTVGTPLYAPPEAPQPVTPPSVDSPPPGTTTP